MFRSIWPLTLEVQRENTPYSSSEPNESYIVNRQSGGEKLKYVLKYYIGVHFTWYRACAMTIQHCAYMSTWCLGRDISETARDRDLGPKTTNRKWTIPSRMVTWQIGMALQQWDSLSDLLSVADKKILRKLITNNEHCIHQYCCYPCQSFTDEAAFFTVCFFFASVLQYYNL